MDTWDHSIVLINLLKYAKQGFQFKLNFTRGIARVSALRGNAKVGNTWVCHIATFYHQAATKSPSSDRILHDI